MATPQQPNPLDAMLSFGKFVPGFDFLQGLMNNSDKALPSIGQWVAPTLDPAELDKRINDLKAVQFWLEQNGRMLATTIQALEVQKMTLSTLQTMNVNMNDLREAVRAAPMAPPPPAPAPAAVAEAVDAAPEPLAGARKKAAAAQPADAKGKPAVDAMEWWGALTKQFSHLANNAVNDSFKGKTGGDPTTPPTRRKAASKAAPAKSGPKRKAKAPSSRKPAR